MSKLGSATTFAAEAALWIAGAALVAGAAGMHWTVDVPNVDLGGLMGSSPSAAASVGPGASHSAGAIATSPVPTATPRPHATPTR